MTGYGRNIDWPDNMFLAVEMLRHLVYSFNFAGD